MQHAESDEHGQHDHHGDNRLRGAAAVAVHVEDGVVLIEDAARDLLDGVGHGTQPQDPLREGRRCLARHEEVVEDKE
eukprot:scaffold2059_cov342-Prasinococcus_capsulatus_cf.AAC.10